MAIPSSGPLFLRATINLEYNGNDTDTNVSLGALSDLAGLTTPPDAMSEFYGTSAFTPPTITANVTTSSVTHNSMRVEFSYQNTGGHNFESGFYFGTSTTMTSNTFYSEGDSTATTRSPARVFSGLTQQTTYYIWGVLKDNSSESPPRFTQLVTPMKSQATDYNYSFTNQYINQNWQYPSGPMSGYNVQSFAIASYYQHINGSYTLHSTQTSLYSFIRTGVNGKGWAVGSATRSNRLFWNCLNTLNNGCVIYTQYSPFINYYNGVYNTSLNYTNTSLTGNVGCTNGWSWVVAGGGAYLQFVAYVNQGDSYGIQYDI